MKEQDYIKRIQAAIEHPIFKDVPVIVRQRRGQIGWIKYLLGDICYKCGREDNVQFAHLEPTGLNGRGRGYHWRFINIVENLDKYTFLCKRCHIRQEKGY